MRKKRSNTRVSRRGEEAERVRFTRQEWTKVE